MIASKIQAADLAITFNVSHYQGGNNISCHGASDGMVEAVIVGGTSPYTYSWNTGSFNRVLTGLGKGVYTFTVTDANSQTVSSSVELIEPILLEVTLVSENYGGYNISEQGGSNGHIAVDVKGGSLPYYYSWSNGSTEKSVEGLSAGTYNVTVTDVNGCSISASKTLTEPTPLHVVSITSPLHHGYNVSCFYGHDGLIDLTVTGGVPPYKYDWNTGSFNEDLSELSAGEYSVRITDDNQVEIVTSIILTEPTKLSLVLTPQVYANGYNLSCHDCANGSLTALCTNGVSPYTYLWSNSQTTPTIAGLQAIEYNCQVTDANGCTVSTSRNLAAPDRDDWSMTGNINPDPATQFMGTTDNKDFLLKTNNVERLRISGSGGIKFSGPISSSLLQGSGYTTLFVDSLGNILRGPIIGPTVLPCSVPRNPWKNTSTGPDDVTNCSGRVGINTDAPVDYLQVRGAFRATDELLATNFIRLGHDGTNSFISKSGSGDLRLNSTIYIKDNGRVGVGTNSPDQPFEVAHYGVNGNAAGIGLRNTSLDPNKNSEIKFYKNTAELYSLGCDVDHNGGKNFFIYDNDIANGGTRFYIDEDGRIGIGVVPPTSWGSGEAEYRLYVKGGIKTQGVKVTTLNFPDYVFEDDYELMSIYELSNFIDENKHLPGIPSAKTISDNDGFGLGEMQTRLMEKVEEQALYIINLQRQLDELKSAIVNSAKK